MAKEYRRECAKCRGTGTVATHFWGKEKCDVCDGKGFVALPNVVHAPVVTRNDSDADTVLRQSLGALSHVVVVGYTHEGAEFFASNMAGGADALWHLERARHNLLNIVDKEE
jgi:hypothetical protein